MQDDPNNQSAKENKLVHTVAVVIIGYCLVPGPLIFLFNLAENNIPNSSPFYKILEPIMYLTEVIFYPHVWIAERFPLYVDYLGFWFELGGGLTF